MNPKVRFQTAKLTLKIEWIHHQFQDPFSVIKFTPEGKNQKIEQKTKTAVASRTKKINHKKSHGMENTTKHLGGLKSQMEIA